MDTSEPPAEIITGLPSSFMKEFEQEILGRVPQEKIDAQLRMEKNARIMRQAGSINIPTLGQKIATIPARLYFRMLHDMGQRDASSDEWLIDLLKDNPALCAPGFKAGRKADLRHSHTFIGGKSVSTTPGRVQS